MISKSDIIAPNIELPLAEAEHSTQYITSVYTDTHVHVEACRFSDEPGDKGALVLTEKIVTKIKNLLMLFLYRVEV